MTTQFRDKLYGRYVSSGQANAPRSLEALKGRTPLMRRTIRKFIPKDRSVRILDVGCGHGALIHALRKAGYNHVLGVDCSSEQVALAMKLGIDNIEVADLQTHLNTLPDDSLDVVVTFDVIEHLTRDELLEFATSVGRVLRQGGRWVIHAPNGESLFHGRVLFGDLTHELAFTRQSLSQLTSACGFRSLICEEDPPIAHGIASAIRVIVWKVIRTGLFIANFSETGDSRAILTQNLFAVAEK